MTLISFLVFLGPILAGALLVHLFWAERNVMAIAFKICLGTGVGLGLNSLLYFLGLVSSINQRIILILQILLLLSLITVTILRERRVHTSIFESRTLLSVQWMLFSACFIAVIFSGLVFLNLSKARPEGTFDAWSIWNRAARFIYRDSEHWSQAASADLYWLTHPDYPLLVPLNVAWGWERAGVETPRIPQMQSLLFSFALIGLLFASVRLVRTVGQASLASLILMSTATLMETAYEQIADIPLSFYILATCVSMYFYFKIEKPGLLVLSGFTAGLAAWTKNEGLLFVGVSFIGLLIGARGKLSRVILTYLAGLAGPILIVIYFKSVLAPASDLFVAEGGNLVAKITDLSRYWQILKAFFQELSQYAGWPINIFILLAIYAVIVRPDVIGDSHRGNLALVSIIAFQMLGYFATFVLTPHDLAWHLTYAFNRLILHVYPVGIFLYFCWVTEPEKIFRKAPQPSLNTNPR